MSDCVPLQGLPSLSRALLGPPRRWWSGSLRLDFLTGVTSWRSHGSAFYKRVTTSPPFVAVDAVANGPAKRRTLAPRAVPCPVQFNRYNSAVAPAKSPGYLLGYRLRFSLQGNSVQCQCGNCDPFMRGRSHEPLHCCQTHAGCDADGCSVRSRMNRLAVFLAASVQRLQPTKVAVPHGSQTQRPERRVGMG